MRKLLTGVRDRTAIRVKNLAVLTLASALAGCATPLIQQEAALEKKQVCCRSTVEFGFALLDHATVEKVVLDESSPVYEFFGVKSYFAAYRLEPKANRYLRIKSYFNGLKIEQYFQPIVQALDAQHRPLTAVAPRLQFVKGSLFGDPNAGMVGAMRVPDDAQFLIVHTGRFTEMPQDATTMPSFGVFMVGKNPVFMKNPGRRFELTRSPIGQISLELRDIP